MRFLRSILTFCFVCAVSTHLQATTDLVAINQAVAELHHYQSIQQSVGLQHADLSYAMRKAIVCADTLIDKDGKLQLTLCSTVKPYFVSTHPQKYEMNIVRILDQLDASWQPLIDHIVKPEDAACVSNLLIRALFGLRVDEPITDRHAKVAVLAALFAPYHQGPVGDCFAVADLIRDHEEYYRHTAKDFSQIIQKGYITRLVDGQPDHFFYLPTIADYDIQNSLVVDSSGNIQGANTALLSAPGFAAAAKVMGGSQIPGFAASMFKVLFHGQAAGKIQVTVAQVIDAMAEIAAQGHPVGYKEQIVSHGRYAFSSLTNNPLLRATECAFAAMAEDRARDYTRGNVNYSVAKAVECVWAACEKGPLQQQFQKVFSDQLNASYRLIYHPNIPFSSLAGDGNSTSGGYQLYKRIPENPTKIGIRVQTPHEFTQLVLEAATKAEKVLATAAKVHAIAANLTHFIQNEAFLRDVLWAYDFSNRQEPDPVRNYWKFSRTPMQSCNGDNPYEVSFIDTGYSYENDVQVYTPKNAQDLIRWCLDLAKKAPAELIPMDSPQHAFNFDPTNPDIVLFLKSGKGSEDWIRQTVNIPCMNIATRTIDAKTQAALANSMLNVIQGVLPDVNKYQAMVAKLAKQPTSVQHYAQSLLEGIQTITSLNVFQVGQLVRILDTVLIRVLTPNDQAIIQQSSIRFASTNWNDGTKGIYFCGYFNPRTLQVSFGCIDEDKTNLQAMDEAAWVNNQRWDVDIHPHAPPAMFAFSL